MKKIIIFIALLLFFYNSTHALESYVKDLCVVQLNLPSTSYPSFAKSYIIPWSNINWQANTNWLFLCSYTDWYALQWKSIALYNYWWGLLYDYEYQYSDANATDFNTDIISINRDNKEYIFIRNTWNYWGNYWIDMRVIVWDMWLNALISNHQIVYYAAAYAGWTPLSAHYLHKFTYDNEYFYFWNDGYKHRINLITDVWDVTTDTINWTFSWDHKITFQWVGDIAWSKHIVNEAFIRFEYDINTGTIWQTSYDISNFTVWQFASVVPWDLDETFFTIWYNTYLIDVNSWNINNTYTGALSYNSYIDWITYLNLIPAEVGGGNVDYAYNWLKALLTWTWSARKYYYLRDWQLFYDDDQTLIDENIQTSTTSTDEAGWDGSIPYDDSIFYLDPASTTVWIFQSIFNFFKYIFEKILTFFGNLAELVEKLSEIFTDEEKTFSFNFIQSVNATADISSIINNNVNEVAYKETVLWKIDLFIKWFIWFFILVVGMAFFIWINRKRND